MPFDPQKPTITSGIRLGTPAATSRGFGVAEFKKVGELIVQVLDGLHRAGEAGDAGAEEQAKREVHALTDRFPVYA